MPETGRPRAEMGLFVLKKIAVYVVGLSLAGGAFAENAPRQFNIASQDLATSLNQFAVAANMRIVYAHDLVRNVKAPALVGSFTKEEGIRRLLQNTNMTLRQLNDHTIAVEPAGPRAAPPQALADKEAIHLAESDQGTAAATASQGSELQNNTESSQEAAGTKLQEIVVTANKRSQILQDVPAMVNVLSGDKLDTEGIVQLSDYANQVPGLTVIGNAGPGQGEPVLRGITTGALSNIDAGADTSPVVAMYLDDVSFTTNFSGSDTVIVSL